MARTPGTAPPPSEQPAQPARRQGVGLFRRAGWGIGFGLALCLMIGVVLLIGYLRDDPGRNPAPAAYRTSVCEAFGELSAGTDALARGVDDRQDEARREDAEAEIVSHVAAANRAIDELPVWTPGRSLDELLGALIITLTNGAAALDSGPVDEDLAVARELRSQGHQQLATGRYGFACDAEGSTSSSSQSTPLSVRG